MSLIKKKKRPLPEDPTCRNCGTQTVGRYCHECGQDVFAGTRYSTRKLVGQTLESTVFLESRTPRTLYALMFRPGFLTGEYQAGRINRYVQPARLFWVSTLIFFALLITQNDTTISQKAPTTVDQALEETSHTESITQDTMIKFRGVEANEEAREKFSKLVKFFIEFAPKFAPYATFLLIPTFAFLLALLFWRKRYLFINHLIFALHYHAFLWIYLT